MLNVKDKTENKLSLVEGGNSTQLETDNYLSAFEKIKTVCDQAAAGDLSVRFNNRNEFGEEFIGVFSSINNLLDQIDAFIRESGATLEHASEGKFYRTFIERGMLGDFKQGAIVTNKAQKRMIELEANRKEEMVRLADDPELEVKSVVDTVKNTSITMREKSKVMHENLDAVTDQAKDVVNLPNRIMSDLI